MQRASELASLRQGMTTETSGRGEEIEAADEAGAASAGCSDVAPGVGCKGAGLRKTGTIARLEGIGERDGKAKAGRDAREEGDRGQNRGGANPAVKGTAGRTAAGQTPRQKAPRAKPRVARLNKRGRTNRCRRQSKDRSRRGNMTTDPTEETAEMVAGGEALG